MAGTKLTLAKAKAYGDAPDAVDLSAFTSINDDALDLLAQLNGDHDGGVLRLSGLSAVTPEQIQRLKATALALELGGVREISVELASSLRDLDRAALRFPGVSSVDEGVLRILAEYCGPELQLGLALLTDKQASILAQSRAAVLSLPSLMTLDVAAADALAAHEKAISLPALSCLTAAAAKSLAAHGGPLRGINLMRLVDTDYPAFAALRRHPSLVAHVLEDPLFAYTLRSKDIDHDDYGFDFADAVSRMHDDDRDNAYFGDPIDEGAGFIVKAEGAPLWRVPLSSVKNEWASEGTEACTLYFVGQREDILRRLAEVPNRMLTKKVAAKWIADPDSVDLSQYGELSEGAAPLLARHDGDLELDSLVTLSESSARALATLKGDLLLYGLKTLSDGAAAALARHSGGSDGSRLELFGVSELTDAACEALGTHEGYLSLGLPVLSDTAANALSHHAGPLILNSLTALSDAAAVALSKHEDELALSAVTTLSDVAAAALARHKGEIDLRGLTELSHTAARLLGSNPSVILPTVIRESL